MAGIGIRIGIRGPAKSDLEKLIGRIRNPVTFYAAASELMLDQTQTRFREQRDPYGAAWKELSSATVQARGSSSPILEVTGALRGGIHAAPSTSQAKVQTLALPYAAIQNEGGEAGVDLSVTLPARPYFGFGDDDIRELTELAEEMIAGGF